MITPSKIKFKLSKDEFLALNRLIKVMVIKEDSYFSKKIISPTHLMGQVLLTKLYQKTEKMLIPIKPKYNFSLELEMCLALYHFLQNFIVIDVSPYEQVLIDKINGQIHKEALV